MDKINLNELAERIAFREGNKINLPIGQVKEVLKIAILEMKTFTTEQLADVFKRVK